MKFRMIDLEADQFKCTVCIKLIIVEVFRKHFDLAGGKSAGRLKSIRYLPGGQVP